MCRPANPRWQPLDGCGLPLLASVALVDRGNFIACPVTSPHPCRTRAARAATCVCTPALDA
jgi:hypothetical protein